MYLESVDRIVLGIDPGTGVTGYGILRLCNQKIELITYGAIELTGANWDHPLKLKRIFERTLSLIEEFKPDELAIEAPFYGKNVQSTLKLGRAQGVVIAAAVLRAVPICEYAPRKIKKALTGNGNASKEQVAASVQRQFPMIDFSKLLFDTTDALAVALCHTNQKNPFEKGRVNKKGKSGWAAFVSQNPERLITS
jgi:crossover junction endodeoxyribonuclease RuvC